MGYKQMQEIVRHILHEEKLQFAIYMYSLDDRLAESFVDRLNVLRSVALCRNEMGTH